VLMLVQIVFLEKDANKFWKDVYHVSNKMASSQSPECRRGSRIR